MQAVDAETTGAAEQEVAAALTIQTAWREWRRSSRESTAAPDDCEAPVDDDDEAADAEESAPPTLTTSGYMTNSVSSCFSELRASHTQESLLALAGCGGPPPPPWRETTADCAAEASEREQWRALEMRLTELAVAGGQRRKKPRRPQEPPLRQRSREEAERERVLRALSSCYSEDDELLLPEGDLSGVSGGGDWANSGFVAASDGMELCFRNDAASDGEEGEEGEGEGEGDANGGQENRRPPAQQWQRFRRPPKNFVPSAVTELTRPMQLCFISDPTSDEDDTTISTALASSMTGSEPTSSAHSHQPVLPQPPSPSPPQPQPTQPAAARPSRRPLEPELLASLGLRPDGRRIAEDGDEDPVANGDAGDASDADGDAGDLRRRQAALQAEAQVALAQAEPMARMQLEVERHMRDLQCRDGLAELLGVASSRRLGGSRLRQMSQGALQLVHNSLLARIEAHNGELVRCLLERDDLHMEQDSMLVEIEDLTRRAQEAELGRKASSAAAAAASAADIPAVVISSSQPPQQPPSAGAPPRRRVSALLTARLKPTRLVSLFTGT